MKPTSETFKLFSVISAFALLTSAQASTAPLTDDSDLSGGARFAPLELPMGSVLRPDSILSEPIPSLSRAEILIQRQDHGGIQPIVGLPLSSSSFNQALISDASGAATWENCSAGANAKVQVQLRNTHLTVTESSAPYSFTFTVQCGTRTVVQAEEVSTFGQALSLWTRVESARQKLQQTVGLDFWSRNLNFIWPSSGDYYSFGTVNITRGDHWDVVLHEMGHAIYDMGKIGAFGGGSHKIDECYSPALALSEGWASYFAGWAAINLDHPDAAFEYLVPRRAPIQIENVPADVCKGPTNEWRVTAFLWDLIDTHDDGESFDTGFETLWNALRNTRSASAGVAVQKLRSSGVSEQVLRSIWEQNFLTSALQFE